MIPQHQGAIDTAQFALKHAKDPQIRQISQRFIDETREIIELQDRLKKHGK